MQYPGMPTFTQPLPGAQTMPQKAPPPFVQQGVPTTPGMFTPEYLAANPVQQAPAMPQAQTMQQQMPTFMQPLPGAQAMAQKAPPPFVQQGVPTTPGMFTPEYLAANPVQQAPAMPQATTMQELLQRAPMMQQRIAQQAQQPMQPAHTMQQRYRGNPRDMRKQAIIQQITGQGTPAPMSAAQGGIQGLNSIMNGFALRNHNRGPFPDAPGGGRPSFGQGLMNFFGKGRGGLF